MAQLTGTVKFFSQKKGYGFITQPDGTEMFVHQKEVQGQPLQTNDTVSFTAGVDSTTGRPAACGVTGGTGTPFVHNKGFNKGGKLKSFDLFLNLLSPSFHQRFMLFRERLEIVCISCI